MILLLPGSTVRRRLSARCRIAARVLRQLHIVFLAFACCSFAQNAAVSDSLLTNNGAPMRVGFTCNDEDFTSVGLSCSDDDRCAIYLELSGVSAAGKKLSVAGNLHASSTTLYSLLLISDDNGASWKEPTERLRGAALEQVQMLDPTHGWAAGEDQVPLTRDPFFLMTTDGESWRRQTLSEDGGPGVAQKFWFDSPSHGELIVDAGRTEPGGRFVLYESRTGGTSWNLVSKTAQAPRLRLAPPDNLDYRIGTDTRNGSYVVEKRVGEKWSPLASFLIQVANCGSKPAPPPAPPEPAHEN